MQLYVNSVTADKVLTCKKDNNDVVRYLKLVNPQYLEGDIAFDVLISLPDNFSIMNKHEGNEEFLIIILSNMGSIKLNVKDFRDIVMYS